MINLAKRELTRRRRQSLSMLSNLKPISLLLWFVNRRLMDWNGAVEQTSKRNQVDMYLQIGLNWLSQTKSGEKSKKDSLRQVAADWIRVFLLIAINHTVWFLQSEWNMGFKCSQLTHLIAIFFGSSIRRWVWLSRYATKKVRTISMAKKPLTMLSMMKRASSFL